MTDIPSGYTPGPWLHKNGEVFIDTRQQVCCGHGTVSGECCGNPDVTGDYYKIADTSPQNGPLIALAPEMADEIVRLRAEVEGLQEALTPSGATKAAYIGEFHFTDSYIGEDGNDVDRKVAVPWTTVKEIMVAIRARAALTAQEKTDDKA